MTWTKLGNPKPLEQPHRYGPVQWPIAGAPLLLSHPAAIELTPLAEVLSDRRTVRSFGRVDQRAIADLLWFGARELQRGHSDYGFALSKRPAPSAGAIHPIHILISRYAEDVWHLFDPQTHTLLPLAKKIGSGIEARKALLPVIDSQDGAIVLFVGEPGKTAAKYENESSLVWRDAGILMGYLSVVAEALRLRFCPLGITGDEWARALDHEERLVGVGVAILGS